MSGSADSVTSSVSSLVTSATTSSTADTTNSADAFEQIFLSMLLSQINSGEMGTTGLGSDLMAPLMLILYEQLLENQVQEEQTSSSDSTQATSQLQLSNTTQAADQTQLSSSAQNAQCDEPTGKPVDGVLTQSFHTGHTGLDFGIPLGTPVKSTMNGKVVYAGWNNEGYGNLVIVQNGAYKTYYAHLSSIPVQVGQQVQAGSVIGISGSTGNSTGPHVHYEIRLNGQPIDPATRTLNTPALWK